MSSPSPAITITNVSKRYYFHVALDQINISFHTGKLYVITGPNGSGKSTLLKCIMGLLRYDGNIWKERLSYGYAPEQYILPDYMTVKEFLVHLGRVKTTDHKTLSETIKTYLENFNMMDASEKQIKSLSNGMKQKVNLIQALVHHPKVLLLDEPFKAIDEASQNRLVEILKMRLPTTLIIISTHQPKCITLKQKKIVKILNGKIEQ